MTVYQIPCKKAKGKSVEVDTEKLPDAIYAYAIQIGLKELASRGMSKLKKEDFQSEGAFNNEVERIATEQVQAMYEGKTRIVGAKSAGAKKGAEHTEAMRLARIEVKSQLKAANMRVSAVSAKDISAAASALIDADQDYWYSVARESLSKAPKPTKGIDLAAIIQEDPKKVKALEEKKEKAAREKAQKAEKTTPAVAAKGGKPKTKPAAHH